MLKLKPPKIKRVVDKVFLVSFKTQYDLASTFMRAQEFYESPKFNGKVFTRAEFMKWYCGTFGENGTFSYAEDWNGFNVPGKVIKNLMFHMSKELFFDRDEYDILFSVIVAEVVRLNGGSWDFYLIGVHLESDDHEEVERHEISHGLYTTDPSYRTKARHLVKSLPKRVYKYITNKLKEDGYGSHVLDDEINACMSTGLLKSMSKSILSKYRNPFVKLLESFLHEKKVSK